MKRSGSSLPAEVLSYPVAALIHASFVLTGMVTVLLGPILPALSARWSLQDSQAGYLFTSQFIGSMVGVGLSSVLLPRRGFQFSLVFGCGVMAGGVAALGLGTWAVGLISVFCCGIGLGITIPATNLCVAEANPHRRAAALNVLNLAWGVGAVACPSVAALLQRTSNIRALFFGLAAALGLLSVSLAWGPFANLGETPRQADQSLQPRVSVWRNRFLSILSVLFFLYVGTENALGGWVASYARRIGGTPGTLWVLTPAFFWAALLLGRALAPAVLRHVAEARLVLLGLLLAAFGTADLLIARTLAGVVAGVSVAGLGLASVFPITISSLSHHFGPSASRVAGMMFALGGLGGATLPWLVGFLSTHFGSLKVGLVVPLLGSLAMIALHSFSLHPSNSDTVGFD